MKRRSLKDNSDNRTEKRHKSMLQLAECAEKSLGTVLALPIHCIAPNAEPSPLFNSFSDTDFNKICAFNKSEIIEISQVCFRHLPNITLT